MIAKKTTKKTAAGRVSAATAEAVPKTGVSHVTLNFRRETAFKRADLIFAGVDHADLSYEVRVFLNNSECDSKTERTADNGYAGRFVVFGHGQCFGEEGHCDAERAIRAHYDPIRQHPVNPPKRTLTITEPLRRIFSAPGAVLESITLVPISKNPNRKERGPTDELFKYKSVSLQTYR